MHPSRDGDNLFPGTGNIELVYGLRFVRQRPVMWYMSEMEDLGGDWVVRGALVP